MDKKTVHIPVPPITDEKNDKGNESIVDVEGKNQAATKTEPGEEHMDSCCKKCRNCKRKLLGTTPTKDQ
jgi:hypothetical protein